MANCKKY